METEEMNKTRKLLLLSSSCLVVLISLVNAHGQVTIDPNVQCLIYDTDALKVVTLVENCAGNPLDTIAYHLSIGYKIAQTSYNDLLDGLRLSLKGYNIK